MRPNRQAPAALVKFCAPSTSHSTVQIVAFSSTIIHRHAPTYVRVLFPKPLRKRNFTYVGIRNIAHQTHTHTHAYIKNFTGNPITLH